MRKEKGLYFMLDSIVIYWRGVGFSRRGSSIVTAGVDLVPAGEGVADFGTGRFSIPQSHSSSTTGAVFHCPFELGKS